MPAKYSEEQFLAAFWDRVLPEPNSGCWLWTGAQNRDGYGNVEHKGRIASVHRVSLQLAGVDTPCGLVVDHLCRVRLCVNPAHLELVTSKTNSLRGVSPLAIHARKTACIRGHVFSEENTYRWRGKSRACKTCQRENERRYRDRKRGRLMMCEAA